MGSFIEPLKFNPFQTDFYAAQDFEVATGHGGQNFERLFDPLVRGITWKYLMQENRSNPKQCLATSVLAKLHLTHAPQVIFYSEKELS